MPGSRGGTSHLVDSIKTGKSHTLGHKKHGDGFEAPRNSLDMSVSTSRAYRRYSNDIPVKHQSSKMNNCPNGTSAKRFIDGEISRRASESHAAPSVVSRLMGMDSVPLEPKEHEADRVRRSMEISKPMESASALVSSLSSTSSRHSKHNLFLNAERHDHKTERTRKPQPRKHPQEEVLQKFKKEFEAWQASKLREHPGPQKNHILLGDGKDCQTLAQEVLNKEKMTKYMDAKKILADKKHIETKEVSTSNQNGDKQHVSLSLQSHGHSSKTREFFLKNSSSSSMSMKLGIGADGPEYFPGSKADDRKQERSCSPARIVILKPNFDRVGCNEELFAAASSDKSGKECSMEAFLEEVKERLRNDVQGKNNAKPRGIMEGTSFSEKSIDAKQIARDIARHIRVSVTKDRGTHLMRSDSTRSIRSDVQMNAPDSPEFIRRDARKFLSEKSKNVLKNEMFLKQLFVNHGDSASSSLIKGKEVPNSMSDFSDKGKNVEDWKDKNGVSESILGRSEKFVALDSDSVSQINLIRSFSAPVSGTSFGKLLLEDQHIAGAQIRRKHEGSEHNFSEVRKRRRDSFNLKGTVSNLRHNLNLRGKFFGRKTRPIEEPTASEFDSMKDIQTAPNVISNSGNAQENSTEVPPSPASIFSTSPDEFCRQDNPSPISPLEVMDYHTSPCISEELNCNATEPVLPEHLEHGETEVAIEEQPHKQDTTEIESEDTAYLHDLLVTAGLCDVKSHDRSNSKLDALRRPISRQVFKEIDEACSKHGQGDEGLDAESFIIHNDHIAMGHKLLFDLVNEALQSVLGPKINCSMFKRWVTGHAASPQGKNLLDDLWSQIQSYTNPSLGDCSTLDRMMARELKTTTWPTMPYEDIDVVGRQIERVVLHNLINDIVRDLCSWNHQ